MKNPVTTLRHVGFAEGLSFLVLVFIAMPLKYFAGMPMAVRIAGLIHGLLFLFYCYCLLRAKVIAQWPGGRAGMFFVASLLPFGPFVVDRRAVAFAEELSKAAQRPLP